jgi:LPPG:FO 2-phospho-L-lactate transferase
MRVVVLSGGVGGARMGRGLARLGDVATTMVVNVGDDEVAYGLHVSPDLDTVLYTLAGIEGPEGWGRADDTWEVMGHLAELGVDTAFAIGDSDLATNLYRTLRLRQRETLSNIVSELVTLFGVTVTVLPASDQPVRTRIATGDGEWLTFQDYFVNRNHRDDVSDLRFDGASSALPAPGVLEALEGADGVIVAPSNPPLSIWPILAVPGIEPAVAAVGRVIGVSPLFGGEALKGPAHRVLAGLGYPRGNAGVIAAYDGLLTDLVIDRSDADEAIALRRAGLSIHVADTRIGEPERAERLARWLVELMT